MQGFSSQYWFYIIEKYQQGGETNVIQGHRKSHAIKMMPRALAMCSLRLNCVQSEKPECFPWMHQKFLYGFENFGYICIFPSNTFEASWHFCFSFSFWAFPRMRNVAGKGLFGRQFV